MPAASASVVIDASRETCFEYLRDPANHVGVVPGLLDIDADPRPDADGYEGTFTYTLGGVPLDLSFRDVEVDPPRLRVFEVTGPMEGTATYEFESTDGRTRFTLTNEYELPGPDAVDSLAEPLLRRYVQSDVESWVENAKTAVETR